MTASDCTPTFLCWQAGRKIILRLEVHGFERITQVASTMLVTPEGRGEELERCPSPARRESASSSLAWLRCARITVFQQPDRWCCGLAMLHQEMWVITNPGHPSQTSRRVGERMKS